MTERDDSARRAGESAGLSVSGFETDTQTDAAEVVRYCPACGHELHTVAPFCRCGCTYDGRAQVAPSRVPGEGS